MVTLMRAPVAGLLSLMFLAGCSLLDPAPREDPVALQMAELERRLESVERVVNNQSLVQLAQKVSELERRADQLQGRDEEIQYDAADTAERQRVL